MNHMKCQVLFSLRNKIKLFQYDLTTDGIGTLKVNIMNCIMQKWTKSIREVQKKKLIQHYGTYYWYSSVTHVIFL